MIQQYINGILLGFGLITANVLARVLFGVGVCL